MPGMCRLLDRLEERSLKLGLASSSQMNWVEAILSRLGIADRFGALAACDMVQHAKPAPDLYLQAAEKLGVPATECIAVEDTRTGVASARAAGMYVVQVRAASTALPPIEEADAVIESYAEFDFAPLGG